VTVRAYEEGLLALREGVRQAALRERAILLVFEAERDRLARLLGVCNPSSRPRAAAAAASRRPGGHRTRRHDRGRCHARRRPRGRGTARAARGTRPACAPCRTRPLPSCPTGWRAPDGACRPVAGHRRPQDAAAAAFAERRGDAGDPSKRAVARCLRRPARTAVRARRRSAGFRRRARGPAASRSRHRPARLRRRNRRRRGRAPRSGSCDPAQRTGDDALAASVRYAGPLLDYGNVIILEPEATIC
jgi:hypothetical protein